MRHDRIKIMQTVLMPWKKIEKDEKKHEKCRKKIIKITDIKKITKKYRKIMGKNNTIFWSRTLYFEWFASHKVMLQEKDYTNVDWRNPLRLLEVIFADLVANEAKQLCKASDCAVDDAWHTFGVRTAKRLKDNELVWCAFLEATKILKVAWNNEVEDHIRDCKMKMQTLCLFMN